MTINYYKIDTARKDVMPPPDNGVVNFAIEGDAQVRWCRVSKYGQSIGSYSGNFPSASEALAAAITHWKNDIYSNWQPIAKPLGV